MRRSCRWAVVICSMVSRAAWAGSTGGADAPPIEALVFMDESPGTYAPFIAVARSVTQAGRVCLVETDAARFAARLVSQSWAAVFVIVRHSDAEPAFAAALREYATQYGAVSIIIWHDAGQACSAESAVLGTMAAAFWRSGWSATGYTGESRRARIREGYVWPDFAGVSPAAPVVVGRVSPALSEKLRLWGLFDPTALSNGDRDQGAQAEGKSGSKGSAPLLVLERGVRFDWDHLQGTYAQEAGYCERAYAEDVMAREECLAKAAATLVDRMVRQVGPPADPHPCQLSP